MPQLIQVDAFTDRAFRGNPAAVCFLDVEQDNHWLQSVAAEMNLSETAFLRRLDDGFELRWFTPTTEVDLCGHATLASAHAIWEEGLVDQGESIRFQTRSGQLVASRHESEVHLDFPATPPETFDAPDELLSSLGINAVDAGRTRDDAMLVVGTEAELLAVQPDFRRLAAIEIRGVMVTAKATSAEYDFVSRFFAPASGIDEDPVTGSAHCCLGPYWANKLDREEVVGFQASKRGGTVRVKLGGTRVTLCGQAVTVLRGEILTA